MTSQAERTWENGHDSSVETGWLKKLNGHGKKDMIHLSEIWW